MKIVSMPLGIIFSLLISFQLSAIVPQFVSDRQMVHDLQVEAYGAIMNPSVYMAGDLPARTHGVIVALQGKISPEQAVALRKAAQDLEAALALPVGGDRTNACTKEFKNFQHVINGVKIAVFNDSHKNERQLPRQITDKSIKRTTPAVMPGPRKAVVPHRNHNHIGSIFTWLNNNGYEIVSTAVALYGFLAYMNGWFPFDNNAPAAQRAQNDQSNPQAAQQQAAPQGHPNPVVPVGATH